MDSDRLSGGNSRVKLQNETLCRARPRSNRLRLDVGAAIRGVSRKCCAHYSCIAGRTRVIRFILGRTFADEECIGRIVGIGRRTT